MFSLRLRRKMRRGIFSMAINPCRWLCRVNSVLGPRGCEWWMGKFMMPPSWAAPTTSVDVDVSAVKDGSPSLSLPLLDTCSSRPRSRERRLTAVFALGLAIGGELCYSGKDDYRAKMASSSMPKIWCPPSLVMKNSSS
jgi:hypothetical protein